MSELLPPNPPFRNRSGRTPPRDSGRSHLMSVIRTLSTSENNEQREVEKRRLEKEYKKSDARLESLVVSNSNSLKDVMEIFNVVSNKVTESTDRLQTIKENLFACKQLLHCKRDELRERWLEGIEHKHVMLLLEQIEEVQECGEVVECFMNKKHYLHATKLLMTSLNQLENDLKKVEALKYVHSELLSQKEKVNETLLEELNKHLYQRWTKQILDLRRQGSGRDSFNLNRVLSDRMSSEALVKAEKNRKFLQEILSASRTSNVNREEVDETSIKEDVSLDNPESDPQHFMSILIECLALLGKLPEAVERIKSRMQKELGTIIQRTTQVILDINSASLNQDSDGSNLYTPDCKDAKLLQELFQTIFDQFILIATSHSSLLESIKWSRERHQIELIMYTIPDVWSKIQATLQALLTEYLNLSQLQTSQQQSNNSFAEPTNDISTYFGKKKPPRKNYSLFKFDASYHAITMNSYFMEREKPNCDDDFDLQDGNRIAHFNRTDGSNSARSSGRKYGDKLLVCAPSPHNIAALFNLLQSFIKQIEEALGLSIGTHCTLSVFVSEYVKDAFLTLLHVENAKRLEQATRDLDQWKTCSDPKVLAALKVSRPILQSTVTIWRSIEDLRWLLGAIPLFADHFVSMMCKTLLNYKETNQAAYRGITQPDSEDKRVISATWAKDEDIKRFLKNLPNWIALQSNVTSDVMENNEDINERNRKEAEILSGNLVEQEIPEHEILNDPKQLKIIAHLHESLEWFSSCILKFVSSIPVKTSNRNVLIGQGEMPPILEASSQVLTSLAKDFEELSHTCLLVLHLEVRLHCFFYLLPVARGGGFASGLDPQEPDPEVVKLNKDLALIDESLTAALQPRKCKYIFEGMGPLIGNILISWVVHIRRINENGIKKMCRNSFSIQQQLTNITMTRELALDKARQFYELMYLTPDDFLNNIVNRGKQFTEIEYMNALHLLHRSQPSVSQENLQRNLQRLSEILGDADEITS